MLRTLSAIHAVFLLAHALMMAGFVWAVYYAIWAANMLHTIL